MARCLARAAFLGLELGPGRHPVRVLAPVSCQVRERLDPDPELRARADPNPGLPSKDRYPEFLLAQLRMDRSWAAAEPRSPISAQAGL